MSSRASSPHKKFSLRNLRLRFRSTSSVDEKETSKPPTRRSATEPPESQKFTTPKAATFLPTPSNEQLPFLPLHGSPSPNVSNASTPKREATLELRLPTPEVGKPSPNVSMPEPEVLAEAQQDPAVQMPLPSVPPASTGTAVEYLGFQPESSPTSNRPEAPKEPQQQNATEDADLVKDLAEVADKVSDGKPKTSTSRAVNALDGVEDKVDLLNGKVDAVTQAVQPIMAVVEASGAVDLIKSGLNSFMEDIPWLMKSLDEVAKIHPFVQVAVLAFKAVYTMEMTRRQNDKRIITLYVSMKDMIAVLVQLREVKDPKDVGPDGRTIEARMQSLATQTANDIKACANVCDTYSKKKLLVKVLKGQVWESKLVGWIEAFTKRKDEFQFALAIHTARAVDAVKSGVDAMNQKLEGLTAQLLAMFKQLTPPDELDLSRRIDAKGGAQTVRENDILLREFLQEDSSEEQKHTSKSGNSSDHGAKSLSPNARVSGRSSYTVHDLKQDLHEDWDTTIKNNLQTFEGKFALQQRQLQEELSKFIHEENNRVIDAVSKGPHDYIKHPELKAIWKEMGWRRNVKARLFVMTLRDNFSDIPTRTSTVVAAALGKNPNNSQRTDDWAFEYINITYLQPIMEAFDDDGSGYITITEVNRLVDALPSSINWSLPHWIAYWAIGWQQAAMNYSRQIFNIFTHMNERRTQVLPENRYWVEYYLRKVWQIAYELFASFRWPTNLPDWLEAKFKDYVTYEEERIRKNLKDVRYDIDALDTVSIVAGPGRIEKNIFTLLYLLMKRDLEIFETAKTKVLHHDELWDSADSILWVYDVLWRRHKDLKALFTQQNLDVEKRFKSFGCEMFEYYNDNGALFGMSKLETASYMAVPDTEAPLGQWDKEIELLNYPVVEKYPFECEIYEPQVELTEEQIEKVPTPVKALLGEWNGFIYEENIYPKYFMTSIYIRPSKDGERKFQATGRFYGTDFTVSGECEQDSDGVVSFTFTRTYAEKFDTEYFHGLLASDGSLIGTQGWDDKYTEYPSIFILKRTPAETMCHRPSPVEFEVNKARALWKFAIKAVRQQVLKERWSWQYFAARRDLRKQYTHTELRIYYYGRSLNAEDEERNIIRQSFTARDCTFVRSIFQHRHRILPWHVGYSCDSCHNNIGGARIICLDCQPSGGSYLRTVDMCDDPECYNDTFSRDDLEHPHVTDHVILKMRTPMQTYEQPDKDRAAKKALKAGRALFKGPEADGDGLLDEASIGGDGGHGPSHPEAVLEQPSTLTDKDSEEVDSTEDESLPRNVRHSDVQDSAELNQAEGSCMPSARQALCGVCCKEVQQPCWFCVDCYARSESSKDYFTVCDDCERSMLLSCVQCKEPYKQQSWYYGNREADNFMCNKCNAKGVEPPVVAKDQQHTYLHMLVRCRPEHGCTEEVSTEARITTLEEKITHIQGNLSKLESMLEEVLSRLGAPKSS